MSDSLPGLQWVVGLGIVWLLIAMVVSIVGASSSRVLAATVFELLIAGFARGTVLLWGRFPSISDTWRAPDNDDQYLAGCPWHVSHL